MNKSFCNKILYLRKEKGISQKQASEDLGISQSLLSHYEKGIRECNLDFVVRTAVYYGVSCDYLLGKSPDRIPDSAVSNTPLSETKQTQSNMLENLNKKVAVNTVDFIFRLLSEIGNREITKCSSEIIMTSLYSVIRSLYKINPHNSEELFLISPTSQQNLITSHTEYNKARLNEKISEIAKSRKYTHKPDLSYQIISEEYSDIASSVLNLLHTTEKSIKNIL